MMPARWLYRSVVALRNSMFDRELLRARKLSWPVVSVSNLSVGGSGKTPFVIMLGRLLTQRGIWIDVLSRGYRRVTHGGLVVKGDRTPGGVGGGTFLIGR